MKKSAKRERPPKKAASVAADDAAAESTDRPRKETSAESRLNKKLEDTIPGLSEYYDLGVKLVGESRGRLKYGKNTALEMAEKDGKTRDYIEKACQLARKYETRKSFEVLLEHLQALSIKHTFALSRSHVMATLLLAKKDERKRYLTKAAQNGWTGQQLRDEIRSTRPAKSKGGRSWKPPKTCGLLLIEASKVCRHLIALRDKLAAQSLKLPGDTWKKLMAFQKKCDGQLEKLRNSERT